MKPINYKIYFGGIVTALLIIILVYVGLNASYFIKQINFYLHPPKVETLTTEPKQEPNHISIPSLGIYAPIVEPLEKNEKSFQEALKTGVVHYPGTAMVGEVGNMYLFGHSSDFAFKGGEYKTVFALLPKIQKGAEIDITNGQGDNFKYIVVDQFVAKSTDVHLLDQNTGGKKRVTLQTSYPIGTALKRYIVIAELQ